MQELTRIPVRVRQGHDAAEGVEVVVVRAGVVARRLNHADRLTRELMRDD